MSLVRCAAGRWVVGRTLIVLVIVCFAATSVACTGGSSTPAANETPTPETHEGEDDAVFIGDLLDLCSRLEQPLRKLRRSKKEKEFIRRLQRVTETERTVLFRLRRFEPPPEWEKGFDRYIGGFTRYADRFDSVLEAKSLKKVYPAFMKYAKGAVRLQGVRLANGIPDACPPDPFGDPHRQLFTATASLACFKVAKRADLPDAATVDTPSEAISFMDRVSKLTGAVGAAIERSIPDQFTVDRADETARAYRDIAASFARSRDAISAQDLGAFDSERAVQEELLKRATRLAVSFYLFPCAALTADPKAS